MENDNIRLIIDYLKFRMHSVNSHGLHSPFMYKLATECFYDKTKYPEYEILKKYNKDLKKNIFLTINDLGAGSRIFTKNQRSIKEISKISGSSLKEMKFLFRIARYFKPKKILELGTSLGKSTASFSLGNPKSEILTIEGNKQLANFTLDYFKGFELDNIKIENELFEKSLEKLIYEQKKFDLIYLDGHHTYEATLQYIKKIFQLTHPDSLVLLDDIYWSKGMKEAWKYIKNLPEVKQSIDTFHYGFLFFRKEQFPENFIIRI